VTVGDRETVKQILRLIESLKPQSEVEPQRAFGRRPKRARTRRGVPTKGRSLFGDPDKKA